MVPSSLIVFLIAAAAVAGANGETINVTNSSTDYYLLAQRDLLNDCDVAEIQIAAVNARYADQLSVIQLQQGQVLDEIKNVNKTYTQQQALNIQSKHCIQKNALQFVNYNTANTRLTACYQAASSVASTLTRTATNDLTYARNAVLITLPRAISACNTANPSNQTKLDECYVKEVTAATTSCNNYLANVKTDLSKSTYDASVAVNTAVKCSFVVENDVLTSAGKAKEAIRICEQSFKKNVSLSLSLSTDVQKEQAELPVTLRKLLAP